MEDASVVELETHLDAFLTRVENGEEFTIIKSGRPIALLTKPPATQRSAKLGTLRGRIQFTPGWDSPMTDEEVDEFAGND